MDEQTVEDTSELPWYQQEADECVKVVLQKRRDYFEAYKANGIVSIWRIAWAQYFGTDVDRPGSFATQQIQRVGPEREYTRARLNDFRSFIRQQLQTALGPEPAYKATTKSSDFSTLAGIDSADRAVNHVMSKAWTQKRRRKLLERAVVLGAGFVHVRWDADGGDKTTVTEEIEQLDPVQGVPVKVPVDVETRTGLPTVDVLTPWQVYYDPREDETRSWIACTEERSKWELADKFSERADELRKASGSDDEFSRARLFGADVFSAMSANDDMVTVHHVYIAPTASQPDGRYLGFVEGIDYLWNRPLPLVAEDELPIIDCIPSEYIGAATGYGEAWDLMSVQQLLDNTLSDWVSNARAFGRAVLANPVGSGVNMEAWAKGLRVVDVNGDLMPQYVVPPKFDQGESLLMYLHRRMEGISGQNAVRRGDPQANIKSGTMAALFNLQSVEFLNDLQQTFDASEKRVANICFKLVQNRSKGEYLVQVAGKAARPYWEAFNAEGFKSLESIYIEPISPMMRSPAGRFETYNVISQTPPDKVGAVLRGLERGDWSGMMVEDQSEDLRIVAEHEYLLQGRYVQACAIDMHPLHFIKHKALLMQLEAAEPSEMTANMMDPVTGQEVPGVPIPGGKYAEVKKAIMAHLLQHRQVWQQIDPGMASMLGIPLPPPLPGTPTGDLAMMTGGTMGLGGPAGVPGGPMAPPGATAGAEQQPPAAGRANAAGGQPTQPKPAQPAQPPQ